MQTVIDREAAYTVKNTKTEKFPIILIITRVRRNTEILAVIHGNHYRDYSTFDLLKLE